LKRAVWFPEGKQSSASRLIIFRRKLQIEDLNQLSGDDQELRACMLLKSSILTSLAYSNPVRILKA